MILHAYFIFLGNILPYSTNKYLSGMLRTNKILSLKIFAVVNARPNFTPIFIIYQYNNISIQIDKSFVNFFEYPSKSDAIFRASCYSEQIVSFSSFVP